MAKLESEPKVQRRRKRSAAKPSGDVKDMVAFVPGVGALSSGMFQGKILRIVDIGTDVNLISRAVRVGRIVKMAPAKDANAISELRELCEAWGSANDPAKFVQIVKKCLDAGLIAPEDFRDGLSIPPMAPLLCSSGRAQPHPLKQKQVVEFVGNYIAGLRTVPVGQPS